MRLLLISDAAHTGFGRVGRELARRFFDAGVDLRWLAINWGDRAGEALRMLQRNAATDDIVSILREIDEDPLSPYKLAAQAGGDGMGNNLTAALINGNNNIWPGWTPDKVLVVADPRAMMERAVSDHGSLSTLPTYNYVPIEGTGLPPFWRALYDAVTPIAMSEFGQAQLQELLGRPVRTVPHGISDAFYEVSPTRPGAWKGMPVTSKERAKDIFGWTGKTVLLRTDRFVPRKDYPGLFDAMGPVLSRHPEALLVIHCEVQDEGGVMGELVSKLPGAFLLDGRWTHPQVVLTAGHDTWRGLPDESLNVLYNAADIYVSPTMAEGFGLCLAEAAACGVPVVTTDYAAGPEAIGPGGVLVPARATYGNQYGCQWAIADQDRFADAVEHLIEKPKKRREIGQAGKRYAAGKFSWQNAADQFLDIFGYEPQQKAA